MIELRDVTKTYGPPGGAGCVEVLKGISMDMAEGQRLAVVGPSGCGKSTMLNLMGALDRPTTGQVLWEGRDLAALGERDLARFRNQQVGFVFQLHHLLPQCTALENVCIPTLAGHAGLSGRQAAERAEILLDRVGLRDRMHFRPAELSGGQRQRVAVARALINRPQILLADEPTGSLDERTAQEVIEVLVELNLAERVALVVVTHSPSLAARVGTVCRLHDGRLLKDERS